MASKGWKELFVKKITTYIGEHIGSYLFAMFCLVTAIVLDMIYPQITQRIVDDVIMDGKAELLTKLLIGILLVGIGRCICGYFKEFTFDRMGATIGSDMRKDLFSHIQSLSMDYFHNTNTGELMARVKDDIDRIWGAFGYVSMLLIEVIIHIIMILYCMFRLNWKLAFLPLAFMSVCGAFAVIMERKLDQVFEQISEENSVLTTVAEENLAGVRTVKAFAREGHEIAKFLKHNRRYYDLNMQQSKVMVKYNPIFSFAGRVLPVCTAILGGYSVMKGEMTLGALVAFVEYTRNCTWPVEMIGWLPNELAAAIASYKKIKKIYGVTSSVKEPEAPVILNHVEGNVSFEHVSFEIDNKEILSDISFTIPEGKTLGIMGATGSGKSSIINLLQRFYDTTEGSIKLDGVDIRKLSLGQLRSSAAVVMQDVFLFSDTISENIKMGLRNEITSAQVQKAAHDAQAAHFIEKLDDKYETVIGERGVGLSGGQKQRISIARALAKHAPILVLDDSTSALDMETEHEVQMMLKQLEDTTKIIIAHRISAVRHADEILFLQDGKVAERGTHEELLEKKGLYYETFMAQYGTFLAS